WMGGGEGTGLTEEGEGCKWARNVVPGRRTNEDRRRPPRRGTLPPPAGVRHPVMEKRAPRSLGIDDSGHRVPRPYRAPALSSADGPVGGRGPGRSDRCT